MKKLFAFLFLVLFAATSFNLSAQLAPTSVDISNPNAVLPMNPEVTVGTLPNGITYYVKSNPKPAQRAELQIVFKAGSVLEDEDQKGLAHFAEHMAFNGTKHFPKDRLVSFLESTGMRFGADVNASTGFDRTYYTITVPLDKPEFLKKGLLVLEDWAHNITFSKEEIEKERGVIMSEWRIYRGAQDRMQKAHIPYMFYKSKYVDRLPIGDTTIIQTAPREAFMRLYKDWYRPDLTAIIAVGDFDKNKVVDMIKKNFGKIKKHPNPKKLPEYKIPSHKETLVSIAKDKELPYTMINIMFKREGRKAGTVGDYRESVKSQLFSQMLSMRIREYLQKPDSPFNHFAGGQESELLANKRAFSLIGIAKTGKINDAAKILLEEAYRVRQHGFTSTEFDRAKLQTLKIYEKMFNERDKAESKGFARECYAHFYQGQGMPGIEYEYELLKAFFKDMKLADINALSSKFIRNEDIVITVSAQDLPGEKIPTKAELLATFKKVSNSKLDAYVDAASLEPLMAKKPKAGKIVSEKTDPKTGIVEMKLSNGARVLLKKTDFKNDEILFRAYSMGGYSLAPDADLQSAQAASQLVNKAGISKFDIITLRKMLTGKMCGVNPYIGRFSEGLSGSSTPADLETMMQLSHLYFTSPRKDMDAYKTYVSSTKESLKSNGNDPGQVLRDTLNATLSGYHKRDLPMTLADLNKVNYDKALAFYKDRFADASDFTFVLVGSLNMIKTKSYIKKYLASLPNLGRKETFKDNGIKTPEGEIEKSINIGVDPKAAVRIVLSGEFEYNMENTFKMRAMMQLLSIRLREEIREEKGGVYGIGAFPRMGKYPEGEYSVYIMFGTDPKRVDELLGSVDKILNEVKDTEPSEENLGKIKNLMQRKYEDDIKKNRMWLNVIFQSAYHNSNPANYLNMPKMIKALTAEDVQEAADKYLEDDNKIQVIQYPAK